jgi:hypothetical protein
MARPRSSGAVSSLGPDRWLVGVEGPGRSGERKATPPHPGRAGKSRGCRGHAGPPEADRRRGRGAHGYQRPNGPGCVRPVQSELRTEWQTQRTDRSACHRICATVLPGGQLFGDRPLAKVDRRLVEEVFAKWGDHLQPPTQARYASTLAKVFEHAKRSGWCSLNPVTGAKRPKVPTRRPDVPATVEVREALRIAQERDFDLYAYVIGLATIGCRRSELLAITVADIERGVTLVGMEATGIYWKPVPGSWRKRWRRCG